MPYKDKNKRLEYQRKWVTNRRNNFFFDKACIDCGSTDNLELDHINPKEKVSHRIWSWSTERQEKEILKCEIRCHSCHKEKHAKKSRREEHGLARYRRCNCRCNICCKAKSDGWISWKTKNHMNKIAWIFEG